MIEGLKKGMKPPGRKKLTWKVLWLCLRSGYAKTNTEAVTTAAQNQALRTN